MRLATVLLTCAAMALSATAPALAADPGINLRGGGKTRENLNALQLKPFDQSLWSHLSGWSNGPALKSEDTKGKVVLVVTWASWFRLSHPAMRQANEALTRFKDRGLIVVGVHNPKGGEGAAEHAKTLGLGFPVALDAEGKFRAGLKAEQDPNVYFIDRAGNLRFAQAEVGSLLAAAELLVSETPEQAAEVPTRLAADKARADAERWKTRDAQAKTTVWPEVEYTAPEEEAYNRVKWPYMVGKVEYDAILNKTTNTPPKLILSEENWFPRRPKLDGKLLLVYFIDPQSDDLMRVIPAMNQLATRFSRDVVVMASMERLGIDTTNEENRKKVIERNQGMARTIFETRNVNHFLLTEPAKRETDGSNSGPGFGIFLDNGSVRNAGLAIVACTDMRVRYVDNPYAATLAVGIEHLIAVDPGVQARRKAEDAKLKAVPAPAADK
jgi:hypothetical protein